MKKLLQFSLLIIVLLQATRCSKQQEPAKPNLINPSNPNEISNVLIMPSGSSRVNGSAPAPTGSGAPIITSQNTNMTSSNGGTVPVSFNYSGVSGNLSGFYIQVVGATTYYRIPVPSGSSSGSAGTITLPVSIPTNVIAGQFSMAYCTFDAANRVSNVQNLAVDVLQLGTGSIQISLSWNNSSDTDLYVSEPGGETISYSNRSSVSGGELDRDDINGFGPENVFWQQNAPDGNYAISVKHFSGALPLSYFVTINTGTTSKNYSGTISVSKGTANVVTMTKSGNNFSFSN